MASQARVMPEPAIQEYRKGQFLISTDPAKMDIDSIHAFLSTSFWETEGIPKETVERSIRGSLCFGVYNADLQVGFARVITDYATYAYLCDDYILESHRGRGLGRWLMECIQSHRGLQGLRRWMVVTRDARLYLKAGFTPLKEPETYLEIADVEIYKRGCANLA